MAHYFLDQYTGCNYDTVAAERAFYQLNHAQLQLI